MWKKSTYTALLLTVCLTACFSWGNVNGQRERFSDIPVDRPNLVVGIVVDQMRWDYLYRYAARYGEGGFKRLLREGFSCENTLINHLPSATAVGHATIYTGSVPAISGIVGNEWIDQHTGRKWYCTEDTRVRTVGASSKAGEMSPANLWVSTITDELRLATNFRSRVVGVSLKDRAAILPAGHSATGAFWFDGSNGHFITSSYYMSELPEWVKRFNADEHAAKLVSDGWPTLYPINTYVESTTDNVGWEGLIGGAETPTFPYDIAPRFKQNRSLIRQTPFGNTLTLAFAQAAVSGYGLGTSPGITDFLTVNCASTDHVGHMFGVNSIEIEDTYLRLDKDLEAFFNFLDKTVGKDRYLVFLSADHGAAHSQAYMEEKKMPTGFWDTGLLNALNDTLLQCTGVEGLVMTTLNLGACYQVNFNYRKIQAERVNPDTVKYIALHFLKKQPGILFVADMEQPGHLSLPLRIRTAMTNGFSSKRSGVLQIIPQTGWMPEYSRKGTTHGGWNPYDTHIPLVFMGWNIRPGICHRTVYMTDIAPTLAALLHIQMPNGCVGDVITEVIGRQVVPER